MAARSEESLVAETSEREMAAMEAFRTLSGRGFVGSDEVEEALCAVAASAGHLEASAKLSAKKVHAFVRKHRRPPPKRFDDFVALYNEMVGDVHAQVEKGVRLAVNFGIGSPSGGPASEFATPAPVEVDGGSFRNRSGVGGSGGSDPQSSAKKLLARQSSAAAFASNKSSGSGGSRASTVGSRASKFVMVETVADAPMVDGSDLSTSMRKEIEDGVDRQDRRRRRSFTDASGTPGENGTPGTSPAPGTSPESSPEFQRGGR